MFKNNVQKESSGINQFKRPSGGGGDLRGRGGSGRGGSGRGRGGSGRGGGAGRGRGRGGGGGYFKKKTEHKPIFSKFKYPKTSAEFKGYAAPGSKKWYDIRVDESLDTKTPKLKLHEHALPVDPYYLPHCFPQKPITEIRSDNNEGFIPVECCGGNKVTWVLNEYKDILENTRKGKRYYSRLSYLNMRKNTKKIYESEREQKKY